MQIDEILQTGFKFQKFFQPTSVEYNLFTPLKFSPMRFAKMESEMGKRSARYIL